MELATAAPPVWTFGEGVAANQPWHEHDLSR